MAEPKWADIEAEEDFEPDLVSSKLTGFETRPDKDGIKTVTTYTKNIKGETVKVIKRVKVIRRSQRINKEVYMRTNITKFGPDTNSLADMVTIRANEEYHIEIPRTSNSALRNKNDDEDYYFVDLQSKPVKDLKSKFKALKEELEDDREKRESEDTSGKYVAPNLRGGGPDRSSRDQQHKEECTVRVTNLAEDVKEQDLTDLFGAIGKIHRIYLAKHKETKSSKGFAFITYQRREDAAKAIRKLNRHGYENLVLNVEWAKPSTKER